MVLIYFFVLFYYTLRYYSHLSTSDSALGSRGEPSSINLLILKMLSPCIIIHLLLVMSWTPHP